MGYTIQQLAAEIAADPKNLGYAAFSVNGNDAAVASLLNSLSGPGVGPVASVTMTRDEALLAFSPALLTITALSTALQSKWDRILSALTSLNVLDCTSAAVQAILTQAITDSVLTQEQVTNFNQRTGSRAEVLWGAGTIVSAYDCSQAR